MSDGPAGSDGAPSSDGPAGSVPVRDAATVIVVRDARDGARGAGGRAGARAPGLEVLLLRRNPRSAFVGGAYVFPGGAVDPADRAGRDLERICTGRSDAEASALLGVERGGLAFWVAAVRECFEEAGLLLALDATGGWLRLDAPATVARFARHRADVDAGRRALLDVCLEEGLTLAVDRMHYFSHWVTPVGPPRRYDTRFFITAAPGAQAEAHDDREAVDCTWLRPAEALERHARRELDLVLPTIKNLEALARFDSAAAALEAAATTHSLPPVTPRVVDDGGGVRIVLPGDPGHADATGVLPPGGDLPERPDGPARPGPR